MNHFKLVSEYALTGDQPQAIAAHYLVLFGAFFLYFVDEKW